MDCRKKAEGVPKAKAKAAPTKPAANAAAQKPGALTAESLAMALVAAVTKGKGKGKKGKWDDKGKGKGKEKKGKSDFVPCAFCEAWTPGSRKSHSKERCWHGGAATAP